MANQSLLSKQVLAQTSAINQQLEIGNFLAPQSLWLSSTFGLALILVGLVSYSKIKLRQITKEIKLEKLKNEDLRKKLKLALNTIEQIETNPDLSDSREFNLDYLRMRMEEDVFHQSIANQIKVEVSKLVNIAFRHNLNPSANKIEYQLDRIFDIFYKTDKREATEKRVLFRIQLKLIKSPSQSPARTIQEIIQCLEGFLNPESRSQDWQPTIGGGMVKIDWDQKAKPTPLLVFQQSTEGMNVALKKEVQNQEVQNQEVQNFRKSSLVAH